MIKLIFIFLFVSSQILCDQGEFFLKILTNNTCTLKVETIPGEVYFNENFDYIKRSNIPTFVFEVNDEIPIRANAPYVPDLHASEDLNGREFNLYYGKFKVKIEGQEWFIYDCKDCDYDGSNYPTKDYYFYYDGSENKWIHTSSDYDSNYGNYTSRTFYLYTQKPDGIDLGANLSCFQLDIKSRNLLNGQDYGELSVDGQIVNSGETIQLNEQSSAKFHTYETIQENNYLFRDWKDRGDDKTSYNNPENFSINKDKTVVAHLEKFHPLTVTNNLEGGNGGSYDLVWNRKPNENITVTSGTDHYAFDNEETQDFYTIEVEEIISDALNTTWYFQNWSDGENSSLRNVEVTESNNEFTANYKGINRTASDQAYASNSQRKFETLPNGKGIHVYESMNRIWIEKQNTGGEWVLMNS